MYKVLCCLRCCFTLSLIDIFGWDFHSWKCNNIFAVIFVSCYCFLYFNFQREISFVEPVFFLLFFYIILLGQILKLILYFQCCQNSSIFYIPGDFLQINTENDFEKHFVPLADKTLHHHLHLLLYSIVNLRTNPKLISL